jgi:hypothetical protein
VLANVWRLAAGVLNHHDRAVLKSNGVLRTRRNDGVAIEQVMAGIPGEPRFHVLDNRKLERLLRKNPQLAGSPSAKPRTVYALVAGTGIMHKNLFWLSDEQRSSFRMCEHARSQIARTWVEAESIVKPAKPIHIRPRSSLITVTGVARLAAAVMGLPQSHQ